MTLGTWLKNHPVPPAMRVLALAEAVSQLGVMEHGGNNEGREVQRYIHEGGGSGPLAWCGYFVAHCYRKAGSKSVTSQWAGVRFLGYIVGMKRIKLVDARPGDIIVYEFTGGGDGDHTGLLEHGPVGGMIVAIEGNTGATGAVSDSTTGGDGVYRKRRSVGLVKYAVRVTR